MVMLVSLEQAREHLRVDTTDGDNDLLLKIKGASRAVLNYIVGSVRTSHFTDSAGDVLEDSAGVALYVPEDVQIATLFVIGYYDRNRDSDRDKEADGLFLPYPAKQLLIPYRDPSLA